MIFLRQLKNDLYKSICSFYFLFSTISVVALLLFGSYTEIYSGYINGFYSVAKLLSLSQYLGMGFMFMSISAIPAIFTNVNDNHLCYSICRTGKLNYYISKLVSSFTSAFLVTLIAFTLYVLILLPFFSFTDSGYNQSLTDIYKYLNAIEYVILTLLTKSLYSGFLAVVCIIVSAKFNNVFLLITLPLMIHYIFNFIFYILGVPMKYNFTRIGSATAMIESFEYIFIYTILYFFVLIIVISIPYLSKMRKVEL